MTREEAYEKMKIGAKVRHEYFTSEEYLFMDDAGRIMTEDGYQFADVFFEREWFATGWTVKLDKVVILGNEMHLIVMDNARNLWHEPRIERSISQSTLQNWLQSRQLAQKRSLRLHVHEGVYSRWNQSKQGGRPFGKSMRGRRVHRQR